MTTTLGSAPELDTIWLSSIWEIAGLTLWAVAYTVESVRCRSGLAGTYNLQQLETADQLHERKLRSIEALNAEVLVSGNIGCQTQLSEGGGLPVLHTVELLDWATGGPNPLANLSTRDQHKQTENS